MKLKSIIKPGIVGVGIGAFAAGAGEASADPLQNWQIDSSNKNQITVHVKKGDTLDSIAWDLDKRFGQNDDSNDLRKNLKWFTREGYIIETDCGNPLKNPNLIEAGEDYSFIGPALKSIDPAYGQRISDKDIQIKTESKIRTPEHKERGLMSDISRVRDYTNKENNRTGKFVLNVGIEGVILGGADKEFGESAVIDINAGYQVPGVGFVIGGRMCEINGNNYMHYRNSFFGFSYEEQEEERDLTLTELYAQLVAGSDVFKIFCGVGMISVGNVGTETAYGYWEGTDSLNKEYDRYIGGFGGLQLMMPIDKNLNFGVTGRYGKYKNSEGLELDETSAGVKLEVKF